MVVVICRTSVFLVWACVTAVLGCTNAASAAPVERKYDGRSRSALSSRKLLAANEAVKTIFSNGWAPGCSWYASGAFNISVVAGAGIGQSFGLCTTFPGTGGWMTFRCSKPDDLTTAIRQSSGIEFYISQLPNEQIGSSKGDDIIPEGLELVLQDANADFTCKRPLGSGHITSNGLVQTSIMFQGELSDLSENDQDCRPALQDATAVGFRSLQGGTTFCLDDVQLI
uniref:Putative extracellular protein TR9_075 n=1 Tax=Trebouxia lynnae TaxID=1825957 RepID=A0A7L9QEJ4_9CHLO|nr:putative extracellular protein TR9_075 [Trebouxia lynnae]